MARLKRLTRTALLSNPDVRYEDIDVPEWGGSMMVRSMTAGERRQARLLAREIDDNGNVSVDDVKMGCTVIAMCCEDPKLQVEDVNDLYKKASGVLQRVFNKILALSGFSESQAAALMRAVPNTEKKPVASDGDFTQPPVSGSETPSTSSSTTSPAGSKS
jgi:hypothetical protein